MHEIMRSDTMNIDHIVEYLEKNGIEPKNNVLKSFNGQTKNVAGFNISEIPALSNSNIILSKEAK